MKISVIGLGYVGLSTMLSFLKKGHEVNGIDTSSYKIELLNSKVSPIPEPGIEAIFKYDVEFSTKYSLISDSDIIFVCVDTPTDENYISDLTNLNNSIESTKDYLKHGAIIVIKSTIPVGTTRNISNTYKILHPSLNAKFAFNPEFLSQGTAVKNANEPNRILIGSEDSETKEILESLFKPFSCPIISTDFETAELAKYVCNSFLATKISFINEMANFADVTGANIDDIKKVMSLDPRIGDIFLNPGIGYGGGCFVKDTRSLIKQGENKNLKMRVVKSVDDTNNSQKNVLLKRFYNYLGDFKGLREQHILLIGFAFKPNTGDLRGSIALENIKHLREYQPYIHVFDPLIDQLNPEVRDLIFETNLVDAVNKCKYILIYSEKTEALLLDAEDYRGKVIFDGRNLLNKHLVKNAKHYEGIGRKFSK